MADREGAPPRAFSDYLSSTGPTCCQGRECLGSDACTAV